MGTDRYPREDIRCATLWRLARSRGWAQWIPVEMVLRAVPSHERGRARTVATELGRELFSLHHPRRGLKIDHTGIELLARERRDICGISEFLIETTLSHFGGFD